MANQRPMRAEPRNDTGTDRYGAETVAAREAARIAEHEEAKKGHVQPRSATSTIYVGLIAVLLAILSVIAVWLKS